MTTLNNQFFGNLFSETVCLSLSRVSKRQIALIFSILSILFCAALSAQTPTKPEPKLRYNVDSLMKSFAQMPDDTNRILFLNAKINDLGRLVAPKYIKPLIDTLLPLSEKLGFEAGIGLYNLAISKYHLKQKLNNTAYLEIQKAVSIFEKLNQRTRLAYACGTVADVLGELELPLAQILVWRNRSLSLVDSTELDYCRFLISKYSDYMSESIVVEGYDTANFFIQDAFRLFNKLPKEHANLKWVETYSKLKSAKNDAEEWIYEKSIKSDLALFQPYLLKRMPERAADLAFDEKMGLLNKLPAAYHNLAESYRILKKFDLAEQCYKRSLDYALEFQNQTIVMQNYVSTSRLANDDGKPQLAYDRLVEYVKASFAEDNMMADGRVSDIVVKYETEKKEQEIATLNLANTYKNKQLWGMGIGLLLATLAAGLIFYLYRQSKAANQTIQMQSKKLTTLMQELHHRVKNNLQIVSSLLNIQSFRLTDPNAAQAVKDSKMRVDAMSLIHQSLYQTDDVSTLNIKAYITNLCESLMQAYGYSPDNFNLKIDVPQTQLSVDSAIPIGLLLNELVTNSFKYAYKDVKNPALTVRFNLDNQPTLDVIDNGTQFSKAEWERPSLSFGKQLIQSLTNQISGKLSLNTEGGQTHFQIVLPQLLPSF